jgi:hypothetical protein
MNVVSVRVAMRNASWLILILGLPGLAAHAEHCEPNPCSEVSSECSAAVDWVIEGLILDVNNGLTEVCTPGSTTESCSRVWDGGRIDVRIDRIVKGKAIGGSRITMSAQLRCWEDIARVPSEYVGHRVRIYGFNPVVGTHGFIGYPGVARVVLV